MKKLLLTLLVFILPVFGLFTHASVEKPTDVYGLWVVRFNLVSAEGIDTIVATAKEAGIRDLFVQVCGRAEAYYQSDLLPLAAGVEPGFDPLAHLLKAAHADGLRVHTWINAFTAANRGQRPSSAEHVIYQHPEWVQVDSTGRSLLDYEWQEAPEVPAIFLDPGNPGVKGFVAAIVGELVENYPVDGVHLDYIRYPGVEYGYSAGSRSLFQQASGWDPLVALPSELSAERQLWDLWRQSQVSETVEQVGQVIAEIDQSVLYSAAVENRLRKARNEYFQDWPTWLAEGIVDFVVPMAYFDRCDLLLTALSEIKAEVGTSKVYPGLGAYKLPDKPAELTSQIEAVNRMGFAGMVFFEYRTMAESDLFAALH